jgi:hypothetical protein
MDESSFPNRVLSLGKDNLDSHHCLFYWCGNDRVVGNRNDIKKI